MATGAVPQPVQVQEPVTAQRAGPAPAALTPRSRGTVAAAQPAVVASAPVLRVATGPVEPPPWLDAPFEDEAFAAQPRSAPPAAAQFVAEPDPVTFYAPAAAAEAEHGSGRLVPSVLGMRWAELVRQMNDAGLISAFARELATQAQCTAFDEAAPSLVCQLRVERETLRAAVHCDKLQAALGQVLQRAVRLEVDLGTAEDSPSKRDAAQRAQRQVEAEQIIHDDPLVRALMAQYKTARIVPGSVKPH